METAAELEPLGKMFLVVRQAEDLKYEDSVEIVTTRVRKARLIPSSQMRTRIRPHGCIYKGASMHTRIIHI